ncbi:MAG: hypothetical protein ACI82A_001893 [Candidatus Azotimanducaceae bacterium]|jgi:hypothetical protein
MELDQLANLAAVIWTNLKIGFKDSREEMPSLERIVQHLKSLPKESLNLARNYVTQTPLQIQTSYRFSIVTQMGWDR